MSLPLGSVIKVLSPDVTEVKVVQCHEGVYTTETETTVQSFRENVDMSPPLPASQSKHLAVIQHPLPRFPNVEVPLSQWDGKAQSQDGEHQSSNTKHNVQGTGTTGTTLWLGAQVLACYILSLPRPSHAKIGFSSEQVEHPDLDQDPNTVKIASGERHGPGSELGQGGQDAGRGQGSPLRRRQRAVELGAGIGLLSLTLAWHGYDVRSTDIEPVLSAVLMPNVSSGISALQRAQTFLKNGTTVISGRPAQPQASRSESVTPQDDGLGGIDVELLDWTIPLDPLDAPIDLIITSDTIYNPALVAPLFKTISDLSNASLALNVNSKPPMILLALERRDSRMVDEAIRIAASFSIVLKRVGHGRVAKAVEKAGWGWKSEDWEGVELWKGRWSRTAEEEGDE